MKNSKFVHLHSHTQYSLLDGACLLPELIKVAQLYEMPALAMTDHGNMFGAIEFYELCKGAGIKPIIGCEAYIAPGSRFEKSSHGIKDSSYHLVLLAKDLDGYKNLMKLVSLGYLEGFYYKPRIDKELLAQNSKGLICSSACLKGEIAHLILSNQIEQAYKVADEFKNIFGKDNFYLEIMDHGLKEQKIVNKHIIKMAKDLSIGLVATNDFHYLQKTHAFAHEVLMGIGTQRTMSDPDRMRFGTEEFYFKNADEMVTLFKNVPEAISNTLKISEMCNLELDLSKYHLPHFNIPNGKTHEAYLKELVEKGLEKRYPEITEELRKRVEHELKIIQDSGFISYFLITWDFIRYAKDQNIAVGPGRGSAAGSVVSYALGITDLDPLPYGLLFERFLNPERVTMPDIDIDFCYERRDEVIQYVRQKYGEDNVAQIITFGKMQAKAVIRDVARVMDFTYADADRIAKLIPNEINIKLADALEQEPELMTMYKGDENITQLIDTALVLEGVTRHASTHAAGVVISEDGLFNHVPLFKQGAGQATTAYAMTSLEKIGLLKMDFLGLRTLTVIQEAVKIVKRTKGIALDMDNLPLDDKKTYDMLSDGDSIGVFQVES
ncbi:MAG: DNA polymerase III subunit alpha, partial [Candidatus Omnitrophota bacterium]